MTKPNRHRKKQKHKLLNAFVPLILIAVAVFGAVATYQTGITKGWSWPIIGSIGLSQSTNVTSSGSGNGNGSTKCTGNCLPSGQYGTKMELIAVYSDGTNDTIGTQQSLPGLAAITIHGKGVDHVTARAVVGYISSSPVPAGTVAEFQVNFTEYNEKTNFERWHYYDLPGQGFLPNSNNTLTLVDLPDFPVPATEVYSDVCSALANGTITCNLPSSNPTTRQVDWAVTGTIIVTAPPQLGILPNTYSFSSASAAQFSATGINGCTDCGGSPPLSGTITTTSYNPNKDITTPPKNPSNCSGPGGCGGVNLGCNGNCPSVSPIRCVTQFIPALPQLAICTGGIGGTGPGGSGGSGGKTSSGSGKTSGGNANAAGTPGGGPGGVKAISLLPQNAIPLNLGGSLTFISTYAALLIAGAFLGLATVASFVFLKISRRVWVV